MADVGKVKEAPNWSRDNTGTLVNADVSGYQSYLTRKKVLDKKDSQIQSLQNTINNMDTRMQALESLVEQLVKGK